MVLPFTVLTFALFARSMSPHLRFRSSISLLIFAHVGFGCSDKASFRVGFYHFLHSFCS